jgi:hypothetical protein
MALRNLNPGELILYHVENAANDNYLVYRVITSKKDYVSVKLLYNLHRDTDSMSVFLNRKPTTLEYRDPAYKYGKVYREEEPFIYLFTRIFEGGLKSAKDFDVDD